jgi:hypothetical protein
MTLGGRYAALTEAWLKAQPVAPPSDAN